MTNSPMTALNKQALREKIKNKREFFDTQTIIDVDVLEALLDELEKEKGYASAYEGEKWHYHGLAESEGERADRAEKALEVAEKRIADLQVARDKCFLSGLKTGWEYGIADDTEGYNREISDAQAVIDSAAGIGVKGE
ncbi:hypothetical protein ACK6V0_06685 [Citrobacter braakii]|uniref:hypothetical protein n=1 Tax=Citrobacter braakii TaxID=57706 RepID=UPI003C2BE26C